MGYLYLIIALFCGSTKGFCGKKVSDCVKSFDDTVLINFIRMTFCTVIGLLLITVSSGIGSIVVDLPTLLISALSGISTAAFVVCWIISVRRGAYVMLDVFIMVGVIVTLVLCKIFFNEAIELNHYIGMAILIAAVYLMCSYSTSIKGNMNIQSFLLLLLCGFSNGITDFSQKLLVNYSKDADIAVFNFYTYVFAAIILLAFFVITKHKNIENAPKMQMKKVFVYILVMAVCLFANSYFKTLAAKFLDSAKLYPLNQGSALILSSIMAGVFFKEKITPKCIIGMITAFIALIIINVL